MNDSEKGWVQIDPTWENTTKGVDYFNSFDLNHIAFVLKGRSSLTPYPAGAYKGIDENTRDVVVNFISHEPKILANLNTTVDVPESHMAGSELNWKIQIKNTGNTGYVGKIVQNTQLNRNKQEKEIPINIAPYGDITVRQNGIVSDFQEKGTAYISVKVGDQYTSKEVEILPFYQHSVTLIGFTYLIGVPAIALISYKVLHRK